MLRRYLSLLWLSLRTSLLLGVQYRWDFLTQGGAQLLTSFLAALPLWVAFHSTHDGASIGGWGFYPATMVFGFFLLLKAILDGAINPSLSAVVDQIRTGTLDFVLLKPADAQFLVSTARYEVWHVVEAVGALVVLTAAVVLHHRGGGALPDLGGLLAAGLLLLCAVGMLYSVWILVVCAAFFVVKVDNLSYLFTSLFDFARWPRAVFRGAYHVLFTYVVPLTVMTSFPADALLRRLTLGQALWAVLATVSLATLSRLLWRSSIRRYTSASS